jgi:hypothetical protein
MSDGSITTRQGGRDPVSAYKLIDAERASIPAAVLCKVLSVCRSGYYEWRTRGAVEESSGGRPQLMGSRSDRY